MDYEDLLEKTLGWVFDNIDKVDIEDRPSSFYKAYELTRLYKEPEDCVTKFTRLLKMIGFSLDDVLTIFSNWDMDERDGWYSLNKVFGVEIPEEYQ